jgi:hypothetical protein
MRHKLRLIIQFNNSVCTSVSIVSDYRLDDRGSIPGRQRNFPRRPDQLLGSPSLLSSGYWGSFPGGKALPGRDADHSPLLVPRSRMKRAISDLSIGACIA